MLKDKIQKALNNQINAEMYSAYLYLSMAAYFERINLKGFSNWMTVQAKEEMTHAMKFYRFVLDRGGKVELSNIEGPKNEWASPKAVFEESYKHEQYVTSLINNLIDLSREEKDNSTFVMLQWFITEQVEEEANASEILEKLKLIENTPGVILMLDAELATRTFVDGTTTAGA